MSKYDPLIAHLASQSGAEIQLTFSEINRLVDGLPPTAYELQAWWANDAQSHTQSQVWLSAGWRVRNVDLDQQVATFTRVDDRSDSPAEAEHILEKSVAEVSTEIQNPADVGDPAQDSMLRPSFGRPKASTVEAAAKEVRRALLNGDSAFTPGRPVWTTPNCEELVERFVNQPIVDGSSFDDKLANQLGGASAGAAQLFAEIYFLNMLPLENFGSEVKRRNLTVPLTIGGHDWLLPRELDEALESGVFHGGVYFGTGRYQQLRFLIEVVDRLLRLPPGERDALLDSPLQFRDRLSTFTRPDVPTQRNSLQYLLFPEYFLPIASGEHKQRIRDAFLDRIHGITGDLDEDLLNIYKTLSTAAGKPVDFYLPPYRETWDPGGRSASLKGDVTPWDEFAHWARRFVESVDLVEEERSYKLEMAKRLDAARPLVVDDDPEWPVRLKAALNYGNLLHPMFKVKLFNLFESHPAEAREILLEAWGETPDPSKLDDLKTELKEQSGGESMYTPGNVTALGSVLLMSRDLNAYPPYRPDPVSKAKKLLRIDGPDGSPTQRYVRLLEICDGLLERVQKGLVDRLDAQGLLWAVVSYDPPAEWAPSEKQEFLRWRGDKASPEAEEVAVAPRAWLVRGSNVDGHDLVPTWRAEGFASLRAANLPEVTPGISRDDLKPIVDEHYAHSDEAQRGAKLDEFWLFLSRMAVGDLVVTVSQDRLHFGRIASEPAFLNSPDGKSNLRRDVTWNSDEGVAIDDLPSGVQPRIRAPRDVLDLTALLSQLEALAEHRPAEFEVVLHDADQELADSLHVPIEWLQECIDLLKDRPQMVFYGPPGTGKTYIAQALAKHLAGLNVKLVQFHPAYSYEDFFEGYRPTEKGGFELRPGPLQRIVADALEHPTDPYVLIIDEINRGNIAKVFGELYFLLEYRDETVELLYAKEGDAAFSLPKNVIVIGTMNTADRSISLFDAAMRRRFAFIPLFPDQEPTDAVLRSWLNQEGLGPEAADLLEQLNKSIDDENFKIGPSYFMRKAVHEGGGFERVWKTAILPLLEEHHYGEKSRADIEKTYGLKALRKALSGESADVPDPVDVEAEEDAIPDAD